jgi:hypothetical protein
MIGHTFSYDYGEHVEGAPIHTVKIEVDRDATATEMGDAFKAYLLACGYHADSVATLFSGDE